MIAIGLKLPVEFPFFHVLSYLLIIDRSLLRRCLHIQRRQDMGDERISCTIVERHDDPGKLVGQVSVISNLFEQWVVVYRFDERIVPFLRYNALLIAAFIRQPNEFISKVVKLPKDTCKVRTKYEHIFLKKVAVSL